VTTPGNFDDLVAQLQVIVDDLDDRAFTSLREAAAAGEGRPADDKRLTQARRSIEKAIRLLGNSPTYDE
jgi:hypothetical protein